MADTIITNSPERTTDSGGATALVVALILVIALLVGGFIWYRRGVPGLPNTGTNINVTVPAGSSDGTGGTTGGGTTDGSDSAAQ